MWRKSLHGTNKRIDKAILQGRSRSVYSSVLGVNDGKMLSEEVEEVGSLDAFQRILLSDWFHIIKGSMYAVMVHCGQVLVAFRF